MSTTRPVSIGMPVTWSIGPRGGTPDKYPARVVSRPEFGMLSGRLVKVVEIIALRTNLTGEQYTSQRPVNAQFLEDRLDRVEALDGPEGQNKSIGELIAEHNASVAAFQASRAADMSVDALAAEGLTVD